MNNYIIYFAYFALFLFVVIFFIIMKNGIYVKEMDELKTDLTIKIYQKLNCDYKTKQKNIELFVKNKITLYDIFKDEDILINCFGKFLQEKYNIKTTMEDYKFMYFENYKNLYFDILSKH